MFDAIARIFAQPETAELHSEPRLAVAALLVHLSAVDGQVTEGERSAVKGGLMDFYRLEEAEVDRLWDALLAGGGRAERCGWLRDRYGLSWQIVPTALVQYLGGPDPAGAQRAMAAMLQMVKLDIAGLKQAYEGKSAA